MERFAVIKRRDGTHGVKPCTEEKGRVILDLEDGEAKVCSHPSEQLAIGVAMKLNKNPEWVTHAQAHIQTRREEKAAARLGTAPAPAAAEAPPPAKEAKKK